MFADEYLEKEDNTKIFVRTGQVGMHE